MNQDDPWTQAFGGGQGRDSSQEGRINYLYQLAQANPTSDSLSSAYNQAYMDYMYPQANPLMEILGMGGGQQGGYGAYNQGGVDPAAYTAFMEGRGENPANVMGTNNGVQIKYDENGQPYLDIPDEELNQLEQAQGSQGTGNAITRNIGGFLNSPASTLAGAASIPYTVSQQYKSAKPIFEGDNEKKVFNAILSDPTNLFRKPSTLLGMSESDYYNRYLK